MRFISDYRRDLFCAKQKQDNICLDKQRFCKFHTWVLFYPKKEKGGNGHRITKLQKMPNRVKGDFLKFGLVPDNKRLLEINSFMIGYRVKIINSFYIG